MTTQEKLKEIRARIKKHHLDADQLSESGDESTGYADGKRFAYFMALVLIEEYFPFLDKLAPAPVYVSPDLSAVQKVDPFIVEEFRSYLHFNIHAYSQAYANVEGALLSAVWDARVAELRKCLDRFDALFPVPKPAEK